MTLFKKKKKKTLQDSMSLIQGDGKQKQNKNAVWFLPKITRPWNMMERGLHALQPW